MHRGWRAFRSIECATPGTSRSAAAGAKVRCGPTEQGWAWGTRPQLPDAATRGPRGAGARGSTTADARSNELLDGFAVGLHVARLGWIRVHVAGLRIACAHVAALAVGLRFGLRVGFHLRRLRFDRRP